MLDCAETVSEAAAKQREKNKARVFDIGRLFKGAAVNGSKLSRYMCCRKRQQTERYNSKYIPVWNNKYITVWNNKYIPVWNRRALLLALHVF